jgi:hypothetical protein
MNEVYWVRSKGRVSVVVTHRESIGLGKKKNEPERVSRESGTAGREYATRDLQRSYGMQTNQGGRREKEDLSFPKGDA